MYKKLFFLVAAITIVFSLTPDITLAAAPFHEGKTIHIIVGYSAGGGYDLYARVIARHLGKHISGNPTVIVDNMTGAGGLIAANHLYKVAKPDSLTIGHIAGPLLFGQVLGQEGIEFDAPKFEYIGSPLKDNLLCVLSKASGIKSIDEWMASKTPIKMGGVALGNMTDNVIRIVKAALGLPIQLVSGYKGTADVRLAIESGEVAGTALGWDTVKSIWGEALKTGDIIILLQTVPKPLPGLPKVPLAINLAKTDEARQLIEVGIHDTMVFARPFFLPPRTPKEQVQILRKAFQEIPMDKEFIAEIEKAKLGLDPVTGEELEKTIAGLFKLNPAIVDKLKGILLK